MHLYLITPTVGPELSVFAENFGQAAELFAVWWLNHQECSLSSFEINQRNPLWPGLDTKLLGEALSHGIAGIGHFDPIKGWSIVSPIYVEEQA